MSGGGRNKLTAAESSGIRRASDPRLVLDTTLMLSRRVGRQYVPYPWERLPIRPIEQHGYNLSTYLASGRMGGGRLS